MTETVVFKKSVIDIGAAPAEESRALLGTPNFADRNMIECRVYRRMLERYLPPPMDGSAKLLIQPHVYDQEIYRDVSVEYTSEGGLEYAVTVEHQAPQHWDEIARGELIWHSVRHAMSLLRQRQWIVGTPPLFSPPEPPSALARTLGNPECLFSPLHRGGPFERVNVDGEPVTPAFPPPDKALILGPLVWNRVPGLLVRLGARPLRLYSSDLLKRIAVVSEAFLTADSFLVAQGSLTMPTDVAAPCRPTGEVRWSEQAQCFCEVWRFEATAFQHALPLSLATGRDRV